jgi:thioredoxin-dependent peroxiredoxin
MILKKGDEAPAFELEDQHGNRVRLSDFRGRKVLVFFFPKANTSGCTVQAESVRDARQRFESLGIPRLGISPDSVQTQKGFDEKHGLGFPLLSDAHHAVAEQYGVWQEKTLYGKKSWGIVRSSFVISEAGKILGSWYKVKPEETVPLALEVLGEQE